MKRQKKMGGALTAALLLAGAALVPGVANAATFAVTNTNDSGAGSLRQAIIDANAASGADVIDASGITGTISLASNLQDITGTVNVNGPGANALTVNASSGGVNVFFSVTSNSTLNVSGLTLSHGNAPWNFGKNGILSFGTANLTDCTLIGGEQGLLTFGSATVTNCTVTNGVHGITKYSGSASVTNCTFSGNMVGFNNRELSATITNCTVSGNAVGIHNDPAGNVLVKNTICVGNSDTNLRGSGLPNINVAGGNNITTGTAADAGLDPNGLQDNNGPTRTIAIVDPGSPAIDAAGPGAPPTDQRGFPRKGTADIGAFEFGLGITNAATTEGNSGSKTLNFPVTLEDPANGDAVVTYSTADGTATAAGNDYEPVINGTITIPGGTQTGTISITVNGDTVSELSETFTVSITNVTNGTVGVTLGTGTIINDDNAPPSFDAIADQQVAGPGPGAQLASVRFEWMTTCYNGDIKFYLNDVEVNAGEINPTGSCDCIEFADGFTTTDPAVLNAYSATGNNVFRVVTPETLYAWSRVVLTTTDGRTVTKPIYDYNGGNADVMNLCDADYDYGQIDQSVTYSGASLFSSGYAVEITNVSAGPAWESEQSVNFTAVSSNPGLIPNPTISGSGATRTLYYNPTSTPGVAIITVTANDGQDVHNTFSRTFKITVGNPNNAPVAVNDAVSTTAATAVSGNVLANDNDADNDTLTASVVTSPAHGYLELLADGLFVYTPAVGFTGTDSFTYRANDGTDNSNVATVTITVTQPVTSGGSKVTGGGLIYSDEDGGTASFNLNPQSNKDGSVLKGKVSFDDLDADVVIRSTSITGLSVNGNQARIFGKATLNGTGSYDYVVDVTDNGEPGRNDTFQIRLSNGFNSGVEVLEAGNIQVHK